MLHEIELYKVVIDTDVDIDTRTVKQTLKQPRPHPASLYLGEQVRHAVMSLVTYCTTQCAYTKLRISLRQMITVYAQLRGVATGNSRAAAPATGNRSTFRLLNSVSYEVLLTLHDGKTAE